ncbi:uncharacterized protein LOC131932589 [Physella acuta]|uniref:uncharacterized protein LOC131932589 n=1 Tax=Physella acuta TaxID=109671 RepID=UPI0027DCD55B|nr:uncharacterized protein LOC131932589 [Physella acuta]XP_059145502.1 uncharacterized protein LOC131932589 [Physella acuta]
MTSTQEGVRAVSNVSDSQTMSEHRENSSKSPNRKSKPSDSKQIKSTENEKRNAANVEKKQQSTTNTKNSDSKPEIRKKSETNHEIDAILARKMSSTDLNSGARAKKKISIIAAVEEDPAWRDIGEYQELRRTKCRRLYSKLGQHKDLALFYRSGTFYAMEAWCSHMGGPLFEGDIEEYKGSCHVMCPWHAYMFDLATGSSDIGLRQQVYQVKVEDGHVFIEYISPLALYPYL